MRVVEKEHITYVKQYEAVDGSVFDSEEECLKYENSAAAVLKSNYRRLVIKETNEWDLLKAGSEEELMDIIKLRSERDIDLVLQLHCLYNPHIKDNLVDKPRKILERAYSEKTLVFICKGNQYDSEYFWIRTSESEINDIFNEIHKLCD